MEKFIGKIADCKVAKINKIGGYCFLKTVNFDTTVYLHVSECIERKIPNYNIGDQIQILLTDYNPTKNRFTGSLTKLEKILSVIEVITEKLPLESKMKSKLLAYNFKDYIYMKKELIFESLYSKIQSLIDDSSTYSDFEFFNGKEKVNLPPSISHKPIKDRDADIKYYLSRPEKLAADINLETEFSNMYWNRELLEILQNADDATNKNEGILKITLSDKILVFENNGNRPFDEKGIASLMAAGYSPKKYNKELKSTGQKGLGFRSIVPWANSIAIFSNTISLKFSNDKAKEIKNYLIDKERMTQTYLEDKQFPMLSSPELVNLEELSEGMVTRIKLEVKESKIYSIREQLEDFQIEDLIFLDNLTELQLEIDGVKKSYKIIKGETKEIDDFCLQIIETGENIFYVYSMTKNAKKVSIALPEKPINDAINYLFMQFRTKERSPFNFLINCSNLELSPNRNQVTGGIEGNRECFDLLIELIIKVSKHKRNLAISDYNHMIFLDYNNEFDFLGDYGFIGKYRDAIKANELFPVVTNEYKKINGNQLFFNNGNIASLVHGSDFNDLLKNCDSKLVGFIRSFVNAKYPINYFTNQINKEIESYSLETKQQIIVELFNQYGILINTAYPHLFIDSNEKIISGNTSYYADESVLVNLPKWLDIIFVSYSQINSLKDTIHFSKSDDLIRFLACYNIKQFNKEDLLKFLKPEFAKANLDKTKAVELLKWLFDYWKSNKQSNFIDVGVKVITNKETLLPVNKVFYTENMSLEDIKNFDNLSNNFLINLSVYEMTKSNEVIDFLNAIGIRRFDIDDLSQLKQLISSETIGSEEKCYSVLNLIYSHYSRNNESDFSGMKIILFDKNNHSINSTDLCFNLNFPDDSFEKYTRVFDKKKYVNESVFNRFPNIEKNQIKSFFKKIGIKPISKNSVEAILDAIRTILTPIKNQNVLDSNTTNIEQINYINKLLFAFFVDEKLTRDNTKDIQLKVLSLRNKIVNVSETYFSTTYNNAFGNDLLKYDESIDFLRDPADYELGDYNVEKLREYFSFFGCVDLPRIIKKKLTREESIALIRRGIDLIVPSHAGLYDITVNSIQGFEKAFPNLTFNQVMEYLLLLDPKFLGPKEIEPNFTFFYGYANHIKTVPSYIVFLMNTYEWINLKDSKTTPERLILDEYVKTTRFGKPIIDWQYFLDKNPNYDKNTINNILVYLGASRTIEDVKIPQLYELLIDLPNANVSETKIKEIYGKLIGEMSKTNQKDFVKTLNEYQEFVANGLVLNNNRMFTPVKSTYYFDSNFIPEAVLKKINILISLSRQYSFRMISDALGLPTIDKYSIVEIHIESSPHNRRFYLELENILEQFKHFDSDYSKIESFSDVIHIQFVKSLTIDFIFDDEELRDLDLFQEDFIFNASNHTGYVVLGNLQSHTDAFRRDKFADGISYLLSKSVNNDKSPELLAFIKLTSVERKERLTKIGLNSNDFLIKSLRDDFIINISKVSKRNYESVRDDPNLDLDLNFEDLNSIDNGEKIIKLFKSLGISIEDYNSSSPEKINLQPYWIKQIEIEKSKLVSKYDSYLYHQISNSSAKNKMDMFFRKKDAFLDSELSSNLNKLDVNIEAELLNSMECTMRQLKTVDEIQFDVLFNKLLNDYKSKNPKSNIFNYKKDDFYFYLIFNEMDLFFSRFKEDFIDQSELELEKSFYNKQYLVEKNVYDYLKQNETQVEWFSLFSLFEIDNQEWTNNVYQFTYISNNEIKYAKVIANISSETVSLRMEEIKKLIDHNIEAIEIFIGIFTEEEHFVQLIKSELKLAPFNLLTNSGNGTEILNSVLHIKLNNKNIISKISFTSFSQLKYLNFSTGLSAVDKLKLFMSGRGINRIVHFTAEENLNSILSRGLQPISELMRLNAASHTNDANRIEGATDALCLSIERINSWLFFKFKQRFPGRKYKCLIIDPSFLYELNVSTGNPTKRIYCNYNAASNSVQKNNKVDGIKIMFQKRFVTNHGGWYYPPYTREHFRDQYTKQKWTTSNQAEILYFGAIPKEYIIKIVDEKDFENEDLY